MWPVILIYYVVRCHGVKFEKVEELVIIIYDYAVLSLSSKKKRIP